MRFFFPDYYECYKCNFPWFYQLGRAKPNLLVSHTILFIYFGRSHLGLAQLVKAFKGNIEVAISPRGQAAIVVTRD